MGQGQVWELSLAVLTAGPQHAHLEHGHSHRTTQTLRLPQEGREEASGGELGKAQLLAGGGWRVKSRLLGRLWLRYLAEGLIFTLHLAYLC